MVLGNKMTLVASSIPLFRQIVDDLKNEIIVGELTEHAALPSERAIADRHDVSRMTARRALEAVEAEGLAYSIDRKGRFVSPKRLNYDVSSMANFISDAAKQGIEIEMKLLDSRQIPSNGEISAKLSVADGTLLFQNTRLFQRQGHATFLETESVIADRCADLQEYATTPNFDDLQHQRYSPLGYSADIVIRMSSLNPDEAEPLGLLPYQVGIVQEQLVRDRAGIAVCFCRQIWRGELAQFSTQAIIKA